MAEHLLEVNQLRIVFHGENGDAAQVVDNATFYVDCGEVIGIVGESGSGKSVSLMSMVKLIQMPPGEITGGEVRLNGRDIMPYGVKSREIRSVRGKHISYIFQEPMTSLNPVLTIRKQITESILLHSGCSAAEANKRALELMELVRIPDAQTRLDYYPNQFSGGMCQRIMIAMAMASDPEVLVADEATTALDVTTQEQILDLLLGIVKKTNTSLIIVTHNLSVVARYAERIYVMYAGNVVEYGTADELFHSAAHPYTSGLLRAIPRLDSDKRARLVPIDGVPPRPSQKDGHCPFRPRCRFASDDCAAKGMPPFEALSNTHSTACYHPNKAAQAAEEQPVIELPREIGSEAIIEVCGVKKYFPVSGGFFGKKGTVKALDDVSFKVFKGETVGIVGESGCGKTTLSKVIMRIYRPTEGTVLFDGESIAGQRGRRLRQLRRKMQFIFQDPYGSLDPRQRIGDIIGEPIKANKLAKDRPELEQKVDELMRLCGLDATMKDRYPHEFSGGQRQRVGIARALAAEPELIICDEPVSALDVSIQAQIINLLIDIQRERGLTYLFVAHDLSVVRHISDRIIVIYMGKIVEVSPADELYNNTLHPYTKALLSAIPVPDPAVEKQRKHEKLTGEMPSLIDRPKGCVFSNRCPLASDRCAREEPTLVDYGGGHGAACHYVQ